MAKQPEQILEEQLFITAYEVNDDENLEKIKKSPNWA